LLGSTRGGCSPFAGGVARKWQPFCAKNSLSLALPAAVLLITGVLVQLVVPAPSVLLSRLGIITWGFAITGWFLFALLSYGHALE
jgi:hypothetical protein